MSDAAVIEQVEQAEDFGTCHVAVIEWVHDGSTMLTGATLERLTKKVFDYLAQDLDYKRLLNVYEIESVSTIEELRELINGDVELAAHCNFHGVSYEELPL